MTQNAREAWVDAIGRVAKMVTGDKVASVTVEVPSTKTAVRADVPTEDGFRLGDLVRVTGMSSVPRSPVPYYHEPVDGSGKAGWTYVNVDKTPHVSMQWPRGFKELLERATFGGRDDVHARDIAIFDHGYIQTRKDMKATVALLREAVAIAEREEWLREEPGTVSPPDLSGL
jgi:hypothetical protein